MQRCKMHKLDHFIESLQNAPKKGVFNPWYEADTAHDRSSDAPQIRRTQLQAYLSARLPSARYLLIAEAIGYQGGHFSGVAMTSERILLGHQTRKGVEPSHVLRGIQPQRTSRPELRPHGFTEPTATIVWQTVIRAGLDPYSTVHWNSFPWHPYHPERGLLTNRTPTCEEFEYARPVLSAFIALFPGARILAIGKKGSILLNELNINHATARHPANGGVVQFRQHFMDFIGNHP